MKSFFKTLSPLAVILGLPMLGACTHSRSQYPDVWFQAVNDPHPPVWEVLPQAAGKGEVILSKRNELGILSNFAPTPFIYHGVEYASLEGFWQMMLFPEKEVEEQKDPRNQLALSEWKYTRTQVSQMSSFQAKLAGEHASDLLKKLKIDWVSFEGKKMTYWSPTRGEHYRIISEAMKEKLNQNAEVKRVLLSTGDLKLLPDHHQEAGAPDEWRYFDIWMEFRDELKSKQQLVKKK